MNKYYLIIIVTISALFSQHSYSEKLSFRGSVGYLPFSTIKLHPQKTKRNKDYDHNIFFDFSVSVLKVDKSDLLNDSFFHLHVGVQQEIALKDSFNFFFLYIEPALQYKQVYVGAKLGYTTPIENSDEVNIIMPRVVPFFSYFISQKVTLSINYNYTLDVVNPEPGGTYEKEISSISYFGTSVSYYF